jgi:hypothetical protein
VILLASCYDSCVLRVSTNIHLLDNGGMVTVTVVKVCMAIVGSVVGCDVCMCECARVWMELNGALILFFASSESNHGQIFLSSPTSVACQQQFIFFLFLFGILLVFWSLF